MLAKAANSGQAPERDFPYFRRLWNTIVTALLVAALVPLLLIGGGMYYYAAGTLEEKTLTALGASVRHHRETVDRFLAERVFDLRQAAGSEDPAELVRPGRLAVVLRLLQAGGGRFTDLGVIGSDGRHMAYAGPYDLLDRNYREAEWFRAVMEKGEHISDVFSGFRKKPHFIIAVRQKAGSGWFILRATVNAAHFDKLVAGITANSGGDSFLLNTRGVFQTSPPGGAKLMADSGITVPVPFDGVRVASQDGRIRVMAWLQKVPWLSVVQVRKKVIFSRLYRVRNAGIFILVLASIIIGCTVLLTTNTLVNRLEVKRRNIRRMDQQLRRANRMTTAVHLYAGFFEEINETLANIESAVEWIEEQNRTGADSNTARQEIAQNLGQIRGEMDRSRKTIRRMIHLSLPADPLITDININAMLENLAEVFRRELYFNNIRVIRDYQDVLPVIRGNPAQIRQVFQNLMLNALAAVNKGGQIEFATRRLDNRIQVTITDSGRGIPEKLAAKIFEPLFTTHPHQLGLGLSICRGIIEKAGGTIGFKNVTGKGAAFTVELPFGL